LPFISPNEVSNCFIEDFMSSIPNDIRFQKYADYLVDTSICEEAKFPPMIWGADIASLALTTNACESYHSSFNSEFYLPHPTIYHFLDVLKGFQTKTLIKIKGIHLKNEILLKIKFVWKLFNKYMKTTDKIKLTENALSHQSSSSYKYKKT